MEFLSQYALFIAEVVTLAIAVLVVVAGIAGIVRNKDNNGLQVTNLSKAYEKHKKIISMEVLGEKYKIKKQKEKKPNVFVIDFSGDIKASQVEQLREEITAVLSIAAKEDEVVIKLDSPGGSVNGYGLAASQLQRIRDKGIPLTVCIDKVAASGGYLMSCVADKIIAAPFSLIGSIGVVAQMPNFHRWLKKHDIDIELLTAGEYKRTLTLLAENNEKGREKFQEELEEIHRSFRDYVSSHRPQLDIEKVSTGEHWLAKDAYALRLVDKLSTSDDYLIDKSEQYNLFKIKAHVPLGLVGKLLKPTVSLLHPWW